MANEDRRIRKTKKAMTEALYKLLSKKPLKNISVREIADLADINRGTFYLHYRDVYDMVEKLENEIFIKFNEIVDSYNNSNDREELFSFLVDAFNLLSENADFAKTLMSKNGDPLFVDKLKDQIKEKCFKNIYDKFKGKMKNEFSYFYNYIVSGCIGVFFTWLDTGMKESPEEMADFTTNLILSGGML